MNRWTMKPWMTLPALMLAGLVWTGAARADAPALAPDDDEDDVTMEWIDDGGAMFDIDIVEPGDDLLAGDVDEFDGPGGFSAPAQPRNDDRKVEKRIIVHRGGPGMGRGPGMCAGCGGHGGPGMGHGRAMGMGMHGGMGGMGSGMRMHGRMAEQLDLTDAQKTKMADIHEAHERKMIAVRSGLAEARLDLRKAMRADAPNQAQIDATIDRMAKLRADAQKSRVATHLAARNVLTPEQKKKLQEGGMGGPMGGGPGMGMGMKHRGPGGGKGDAD